MRWIHGGGTLLLMLSAAGCGTPAADVEQATARLVDVIPQDKWSKLSSRRIVFAHKSVGFNIVDGVTSLAQTNPEIGLRVIHSRTPDDFDAPVLGHFENGVNGDPVGKLNAFREALDGGLGKKVDVAFLKFCWADFTGETDYAELFDQYKHAMMAMKAAHPGITFVHLTVPLTIRQSGPKALVKKVLGRPIFGDAENVARNRFNELVRREYGHKEPLFDLAGWESTRPDGSRKEFQAGGQTYQELVGEYTPDSGHLNTQGQRWIAAHLLAFLASLPASGS